MSQGNFDQHIPLDKVIELRSRGVPNNQIIQILQNDGYSSDQIFDAMNQADMTQNIGQGMHEPAVPMNHMENTMQMQPQAYGNFQQVPPMAQPQQMMQSNMPSEEIDPGIMQKLKEFDITVSRINEWKDKVEQRLTHLEANQKAIKDQFDKLHMALIGKIGEYDQNILNVGVEIKAMEKVFQKILPTFTENVQELSRLTKNMKQ